MCSSLKDDDEGMAAEARGPRVISFSSSLAAELSLTPGLSLNATDEYSDC